MSMSPKFPFIVIEGCDGSGKTTIRREIFEGMLAAGVPCKLIGQHSWLKLKDARLIVRLRQCKHQPTKACIAAAYASDKCAHGEINVKPALSTSAVVADRWIYSDAVYHSVLYGIPVTQTMADHKAKGTICPQAVVYVSTPVEEAYRRIVKRGRPTRHYERPADLHKIVGEYETLFSHSEIENAQIIRFCNTASNVEQRVKQELMPALLTLVRQL